MSLWFNLASSLWLLMSFLNVEETRMLSLDFASVGIVCFTHSRAIFGSWLHHIPNLPGLHRECRPQELHVSHLALHCRFTILFSSDYNAIPRTLHEKSWSFLSHLLGIFCWHVCIMFIPNLQSSCMCKFFVFKKQ